jgi:phosphoserine phosphatase RsbU/P
MRILIAEDDPTSRRLLDIILTKWGFEVISTCDGDEAWVELQKKDSPNLVILDWMMPGSSGIEVCKKIRKSPAHTMKYIILLTALGSEDNIIQGLESGADDYISKPYNKNELRVRIGVGERIVRLQQQLQETILELQQSKTGETL